MADNVVKKVLQRETNAVVPCTYFRTFFREKKNNSNGCVTRGGRKALACFASILLPKQLLFEITLLHQ